MHHELPPQPSAAPTGEAPDARFLQLLRTYWGYTAFRGIQADIIRSVAAGHDTLGLMPTGGGKSITFQVPALAMPGLCLVVTPLIALMKDQVDHLRHLGITAAAVYSGQTHEEQLKHLDNAVLGGYKFLYVSPERLATPPFQNKVQRMQVSLLTVDEAHCISQWGYDFRPHYLRIAEVRRLLPGVPVLALTATATPQVVADIQERLHFAQPCVYRMSFERSNLRYVVRHTENKHDELLHILQCVPGSAIVYTRSRGGTRQVAEQLQAAGIEALYYHAGLTTVDKDVRQRTWQSGRVRVMVATNAFGMGIDKPDVRLVVHTDLPDSLEAYFQEAGRAGRDGHTAFAVLLYNKSDHSKLMRRVPETFPPRDYVRRVYEDVTSFLQVAEGEGEGRTYEFELERFCRVFHHFPVPAVSALQLLTRAGYIDYREEDENTSRLLFLVTREQLYHVEGLSQMEERVLNAVMRTYGGIFADYVSLDESRLAAAAQLTAEQVYHALRQLTLRRILNYVPRKRVPRITFTQRRVDTCYVQLDTEVYDRRLEQYKARIDAMLGYATEHDTCRSRYLLHYFGDDSADCGHCDVCRDAQAAAPSATEAEQTALLVQRYLRLLADGQLHHPDEFRYDGLRRAAHDAALRHLLDEGLAVLRDGRWLRAR